MVEEDQYESCDVDAQEGAYWRWAEYAVPVRKLGGWSLNVTDGLVDRWSLVGGAPRLTVEEWLWECICAHFAGDITIQRPGSPTIQLPAGGSAAEMAPLLESLGLEAKSAWLNDGGELRLELKDGSLLVGQVELVHCDAPEWELAPSTEGWELWAE